MTTNNVNPVINVGDAFADCYLPRELRDGGAASFLSVEYDGQPVLFARDGWINGTHVTARFGKHLDDWFRLAETKAYLRALAKALNTADVRDLRRTKRGRGGYTMLHPKLGVALARWCNVDFSVWCDLQIDRILRGGFASATSNPNKRSSVSDREPLLTIVAACVARLHLSFTAVYTGVNQFVGVAHARDMTRYQVCEAVGFGGRLLACAATPEDYSRIDQNRTALGRVNTQLSLFEGFETEDAE
ncbi:KilA-N domain-containing protein [Caballeronia sp. INML2]|uniref:KilA-N domain-containing protein n=1 Tax=Caballeronia sp. INML2 TaxID=2921748 RepID=UPI002027F506|nr:KilA-N domain-containing protein [Caballeronia sp. INML2]